MRSQEIAQFVQQNVEPLPDQIYGNRYRAAAYLKDGTYLPCVVFQSKKAQVELALHRFDQLHKQPDQYRMVVESFCAKGSRVADYEIKSVEASPFAWPLQILKTIRGETVMSWTAFVVEMKDGTMHSYGTTYSFEFFDLPTGYTYFDISKIHSGVVYSRAGGLAKFSMDSFKEIITIREKPFFTCYLSEL